MDLTYKNALCNISEIKHLVPYVPYLTNVDFDPAVKFQIPGNRQIINTIFNEYIVKQRRGYFLDFDDLILFTIYILRNFEEVKSKWNDRIKYIQVDEFQDVNGTQYQLLQLLLGTSNNLFVVGDPDQNIYSFRGANLQLFLGLDQLAQRVGTRFIDIVLDDNYRSFQSILDISNQMIAHNTARNHKNLHAAKGQGDKKPVFFHADSDAKDYAERGCTGHTRKRAPVKTN